MHGNVSWSQEGEELWEASIVLINRSNGMINFTYENRDDKSEGRISLKESLEDQKVQGFYVLEGESQDGMVSGRFTLLSMEKIIFEGVWIDEEGKWDFYLEGNPTQGYK